MASAAVTSSPDPAARGRAAVPAGTPAWVTADLIERTRRLWQKRSDSFIGPDEAVGIILRVGTLFDVLARR